MEVERARLTHRLAKIKEEDGDINAAAAVMLELQVFHLNYKQIGLLFEI